MHALRLHAARDPLLELVLEEAVRAAVQGACGWSVTHVN
jgi:hypothetical protein